MSLGIQLIDDPSSLLPTVATLRFRPRFVEAVGAHTHGIDMLQVRLQVGDMQLNDDSCRQFYTGVCAPLQRGHQRSNVAAMTVPADLLTNVLVACVKLEQSNSILGVPSSVRRLMIR